MSVLFLIASLGAINGFLLSVFIIFRKKGVVNKYFGCLLLVLSIRIGKSVFFYFTQKPDLLILQIGLSACVFIGPFFYLFSKALDHKEQKFRKADLMLLFSLLAAILIIGSIYPYRAYPLIWNNYIIFGIYGIWLLFTVLGIYHSAKIIKDGAVSMHKNSDKQYMIAIVLSMVFITTTYQIALFTRFAYIWGALIFSFTFYYLTGRILLTGKSITPKNNPPQLANAAALLQSVNELMQNTKPYLNRDLKLDELAAQNGLSKHTLSQLLNEVYKHGFSQYIKEYRIAEAKTLIHARPELTLEGIGYESGFKSKSAFFEAFKNIEKCTPASYKNNKEGSFNGKTGTE